MDYINFHNLGCCKAGMIFRLYTLISIFQQCIFSSSPVIAPSLSQTGIVLKGKIYIPIAWPIFSEPYMQLYAYMASARNDAKGKFLFFEEVSQFPLNIPLIHTTY